MLGLAGAAVVLVDSSNSVAVEADAGGMVPGPAAVAADPGRDVESESVPVAILCVAVCTVLFIGVLGLAGESSRG